MVEAIDGYRWVKSVLLLYLSHPIHRASADTADVSRRANGRGPPYLPS